MTSQRIVPCLWFDDQAEQAAALYTRAFEGGRVVAVSRFPEQGANPAGRPPGSVLTVELELAGFRLTLLNGGPQFVMNPTLSFFVHTKTAAEADRRFAALAEGGQVLMPLDAWPWSERYGWVQDRYGASWQVMAGRPTPLGATFVPCLMFAGRNHKRAQEAMRLYSGIFDGRVDSLERYAPGEGPEDSVKHGRIVIAGQELVAMDSHLEHQHAFNEAISLQVMCDDQRELDRVWEALTSSGGEESMCGWLKDRFGLSWQVVPTRLADWMTSPDAAARDRGFKALLEMKKLDIAALQAAFDGR